MFFCSLVIAHTHFSASFKCMYKKGVFHLVYICTVTTDFISAISSFFYDFLAITISSLSQSPPPELGVLSKEYSTTTRCLPATKAILFTDSIRWFRTKMGSTTNLLRVSLSSVDFPREFHLVSLWKRSCILSRHFDSSAAVAAAKHVHQRTKLHAVFVAVVQLYKFNLTFWFD